MRSRFRSVAAVFSVLSMFHGAAHAASPVGDSVRLTVELPEATPVALDEGLRFALREGGKTVGSGVVTKVLA